jgi:ketosteroid isomerase-like protein
MWVDHDNRRGEQNARYAQVINRFNDAFLEHDLTDPQGSFQPEDVVVSGDRATIRWRYRFDEGDENSVRGVTLMQVRDGKIVEALGYVKAGLRPGAA